MKVLAILDQRNGKLKSSSLEAVTVAARLAGNAADCAAVVVGSGVGGIAAEVAGYGADKVFTADSADLANFNCLSYSAAIQAAAESFGAEIIVGCATPMGRDLLPRLAARLDAGLVTDLVAVEVDGGFVKGTKPMYAGKCLAEVQLQNCKVQLVSIRPNVFAAEKSGQGAATSEAVNASGAAEGLTTKEVRKGQSERPDLTEATFIISGGRAMANADNFKILNDCADVIGATVGASRAAVDSGYASHDMQVGQTGKVVNPNLYIACGISGSVQHMAGMRTAKTIVAINTDPEAPIFGIADYGIVADLFEAVPILTEKLKGLVN